MEVTTAEEIKRSLKDNAEKLPLGYQFLKQPTIGKGVLLTSHSTFHNSHQYPIGIFYKPISILDL